MRNKNLKIYDESICISDALLSLLLLISYQYKMFYAYKRVAVDSSNKSRLVNGKLHSRQYH